MKIARICSALFIAVAISITFAGCKTSNKLDVKTYCKEDVSYKLNGSDSSSTLKFETLIDGISEMNTYSVFQITTDKNWTYGLEIEQIKFSVVLSEVENVDIDVTISNLESADNYNSTQDTFFYNKTLSINKEVTDITLDINDIFINKDSVISIEVVNSCYNKNPNLKMAFGNFQMFGQHPEINY